MTTVDAVLESLVAGGAVIVPGQAEHEYIVSAMGDLALDPPVKLTIDPTALKQHLESFGEAAIGAFPETSPPEAARRLMSIEIESILVTDGKPLSITVTPDDVEVVRSDEQPEPHPNLTGTAPGDLRWVVNPPGGSPSRAEPTAEGLLNKLAGAGVRVEPTGREHEYLVTGSRAGPFEPPVRLTLDPAAFEQFLLKTGKESPLVLQGIPELKAGFVQVSFDLDDLLFAPEAPGSVIVVTPNGFQVIRSRR